MWSHEGTDAARARRDVGLRDTEEAVKGASYERGLAKPPRIVVGLSGSDGGWRAANYAVGLAVRTASDLIFVHAVPPPRAAALDPFASVIWVTSRDRIARDVESEVGRLMADVGIDWRFCSPHGAASTQLGKVAREIQADIVVVGSPGRVTPRITGSVPTRLMVTRQWPVVVVP